jgi:hypothetical protein
MEIAAIGTQKAKRIGQETQILREEYTCYFEIR